MTYIVIFVLTSPKNYRRVQLFLQNFTAVMIHQLLPSKGNKMEKRVRYIIFTFTERDTRRTNSSLCLLIKYLGILRWRALVF